VRRGRRLTSLSPPWCIKNKPPRKALFAWRAEQSERWLMAELLFNYPKKYHTGTYYVTSRHLFGYMHVLL